MTGPASTAAPSAVGPSSTTAFTDVTGAAFPLTAVSLATLRTANPGITFSVRALRYGGLERAYLVAVPGRVRAGDRSLPLFVVLNGYHASAAFESERTGFLPSVSRGAMIAIYPVGYRESWDIDAADSCCHEAAQRGLDDDGFVAAATRDAEQWLPVDPARAYLVGHSNGARLAFTVACDHGELFAAVATMAAVLQRPCSHAAAPPISALVAIGTADHEQPSQTQELPPVPLLDATAALFRRRDGCTSDTTTSHTGVATVVDWRSCPSGRAVRRVVYRGVGHDWPGVGHHRGETTVASDAALARLIEQFFAHRRR